MTIKPNDNAPCNGLGGPFHGMQLMHPKNISNAVPSNSARNNEITSTVLLLILFCNWKELCQENKLLIDLWIQRTVSTIYSISYLKCRNLHTKKQILAFISICDAKLRWLNVKFEWRHKQKKKWIEEFLRLDIPCLQQKLVWVLPVRLTSNRHQQYKIVELLW